jgi:hypothetical protein
VAAVKAHIRLGHPGEDESQYEAADPEKVIVGPVILEKESEVPNKKDPAALVEEATKDMTEKLTKTIQDAFTGIQTPPPAPPAPAQPQAPTALSEATGQRICQGLECLKEVGEQFKEAATQIVQGRSSAEEKGDNSHADSEKHTKEKVEKIMDDLIGCPDGVCTNIVRRKVLYHWDTVFPNMTLRRRADGEIEVVDKETGAVQDKEQVVASLQEAAGKPEEKPAEPEKPAEAAPTSPEAAPAEPEKPAEAEEKPEEPGASGDADKTDGDAEGEVSDDEEEEEYDPTDF